jgi:hypothetical protein
MSHSALYDDDILLWSEQQAEAIRRLGRTRRDLPNELDIENVAEEVESVGRSELAAVESQIQNILVHLIKLAVLLKARSAPHWRSETFAFHAELMRRYTPSMRQRIDIQEIWTIARTQALLLLSAPGDEGELLPVRSPFSVDDLLVERVDVRHLAEILASRSHGPGLSDLAQRNFDLDL